MANFRGESDEMLISGQGLLDGLPGWYFLWVIGWIVNWGCLSLAMHMHLPVQSQGRNAWPLARASSCSC